MIEMEFKISIFVIMFGDIDCGRLNFFERFRSNKLHKHNESKFYFKNEWK